MLIINTLSLFLGLILMSCADGPCTQIRTSLEAQSKGENEFEYSMESAFPFEWDELFIFDSYIYPNEISETLGYDCECEVAEDPDNQMFFSKDGKMIGSFTTDCRSYSFVKMRANGVIRIKRDASFRVEKRLLNGREHFYIFVKK